MPAPAATRLAPLLVLAALASAALAFRVQRIDATLPYPRHIDEASILDRARRMLDSGDPNPHYFRKPTMPIYLGVLGLAAGRALESGEDAARERLGYPFHVPRRVVRPVRYLFAALSVAFLAVAGLLAARLAGTLWAAPLAVVLLSMSEEILASSWHYLNGDLVGSAFALGALALVAPDPGEGRPISIGRFAAAGALAGLAAASKYPFGLVLASVVATAIVVPGIDRVRAVVVAGLAAGLAFLLGAPFTLLDFEGFLEGFSAQAETYGRAPHLPTMLLRHAEILGEDLGLAVPLAALAGFAFVLRRSPARATALLLGPLLLFVALSRYRLLFHRNGFPVAGLLAALAAVGVVELSRALASRLLAAPTALRTGLAGATVAAILSPGLPLGRLPEIYSLELESRRQAVAWLREHVPEGAAIVAPRELGIDVGPLRARWDVREPRLAALPGAVSAGAFVLVPALRPHRIPRDVAPARALEDAVRQVQGRPRAVFGRAPILVGYPKRVPWGEPKIAIVEAGGAQLLRERAIR